ncbi:MAG: HNH endonuclease, partial [Armatimonadetes bacterium]|nr:HNH endonuclease [Armatimonadota bacterium]
QIIHELARNSTGTVTAYRLLLGRCLLALHRNGDYEQFGCSGSIHYATRVLGICERVARTARFVARRLEELPLLTAAAEHGHIDWSKLRVIVGKASEETEAFWLELSRTLTCGQLAELVKQAPDGGVPGDLGPDAAEAAASDLRFTLNPEARRIVEQGLVSLSQEAGRPVPLAEAVEYLFAERLARRPVDQKALERKREQARRDLEAEERVFSKNVREARELARSMGLVQHQHEHSTDTDPTVFMEEGSADTTQERHTWVMEGDDQWRAMVAAEETSCPGTDGVKLVSRAKPHWGVRFNPEARGTTPAQTRELRRRDCYRCMTPHCPNTVWLETHHIHFYSEGGRTVPANLLTLCSRCHANVHRGSLKIEGTAPDNLTFRDTSGRDMAHVIGTQVAGWIDFWLGWFGDQSHTERFHNGGLELVPG